MAEDEDQPVSRFRVFLRLSVLVAIVLVGGAAGYLASRLVTAQAESPQPAEQEEDEDSREYEYYDFEPITVTLNTRQKDRSLRATITLALIKKEYKATAELLEKRKPLLKDKLITYLSGLGLDDVGDSRQLNKIRREILDAFNQELWPNAKPQIDHLLFKEFALQ